MKIQTVLCLFIITFSPFGIVGTSTDYYEILGVSRTATTKEIRIAFKKLAVRMHPDKNKGDAKAHDKFVKINRAYEILKDAELRRKYDVHGEEGLKDDNTGSGRYESWQFYREEFGIYDEDQEIITLTLSDFETSVHNSDDVWFINFYSPYCSHCHHLAPTWREVARDLDGVVRVGAVNCQDEMNLCTQEGIRGLPGLALYSEGARQSLFHGDKTKDELVNFALTQIPINGFDLTANNFDELLEKSSQPWLISVCGKTADCMLPLTVKKLAIMLDGLVTIGTLDCHWQTSLCSKLAGIRDGGVIFLPQGLRRLESGDDAYTIEALNTQEIGRLVLERLPAMTELNPDDLKVLQEQLESRRGGPFLIRFYTDNTDTTTDIELRKLPVILAQRDIKTGQLNCKLYSTTCQQFYIVRSTKFAIFKQDGYEFHYGRMSSHDLTNFARSSVENPLLSLDPIQFKSRVLDNKEMWLVDFFAPWCPPCMHLLPNFKKAAKENTDKRVQFGTVDCTVHRQLCRENDVSAYPTLLLFNNTISHHYSGSVSLPNLMDFIEDILNPKVVPLDSSSFSAAIGNGKWWLVDFFAPWCAPCQTLAVEWRSVAKMFLSKEELVQVGSVDCTAYKHFCRQHNVRGYPTIRIYHGLKSYWEYSGFHRDAESIYRWAYDFLPSKVRRVRKRFFDSNILNSAEPWLLDFYAPWCGPCHTFAPKFAEVAETLSDVRLGKVNCVEDNELCRRAQISGYPTVLLYPGYHRRDVGIEIDSMDTAGIVSNVLKLLKREHTEL